MFSSMFSTLDCHAAVVPMQPHWLQFRSISFDCFCLAWAPLRPATFFCTVHHAAAAPQGWLHGRECSSADDRDAWEGAGTPGWECPIVPMAGPRGAGSAWLCLVMPPLLCHWRCACGTQQVCLTAASDSAGRAILCLCLGRCWAGHRSSSEHLICAQGASCVMGVCMRGCEPVGQLGLRYLACLQPQRRYVCKRVEHLQQLQAWFLLRESPLAQTALFAQRQTQPEP